VILRLLGRLLGAATLVLLARAAHGVPHAMGARRARLGAVAGTSPHAPDGVFHNTEPGVVIRPGSGPALLRAALTRGRGCSGPGACTRCPCRSRSCPRWTPS